MREQQPLRDHNTRPTTWLLDATEPTAPATTSTSTPSTETSIPTVNDTANNASWYQIQRFCIVVNSAFLQTLWKIPKQFRIRPDFLSHCRYKRIPTLTAHILSGSPNSLQLDSTCHAPSVGTFQNIWGNCTSFSIMPIKHKTHF